MEVSTCIKSLTSLQPSQLKQLRQQLATTQRLLDSYDTRGTAGDLRELSTATTHGRGSRGRGDFVTYGRSRARPSAAARGAGTPAAASVSAAAGPRTGIHVDIDYES